MLQTLDLNGDMFLEKSNISKSDVQEVMDNFRPLQSSFDQLVYNIGNISSEVDISYITRNGVKADKSKATFIFSLLYIIVSKFRGKYSFMLG